MPQSAQQPLRQHQPGLGQQIDQSARPIEALEHSNQYDTNCIAEQRQQPREYLAGQFRVGSIGEQYVERRHGREAKNAATQNSEQLDSSRFSCCVCR